MTPRQRIALEHPCWRAFETVHERFAAEVAWRGLRCRTLITVNR